MFPRIFFFLLFISFAGTAISQNYSQSLIGIVKDIDTDVGIQGVIVSISNGNFTDSILTNERGEFAFEGIRVGRVDLLCRHNSYKIKFIKDIRIDSGKAIHFDILLSKNVYSTEEVLITEKKNKGYEFQNSKHQLNLNLAKRTGGNFGDPVRMMSRFAGVSNPDDLRNNLIIRGNSPVGVAWYIEGISTINPNHFATVGNSGGGVSILNSLTLSSLNLYTGAFPSEFGNAISGIAETNLRKGNSREKEFSIKSNIIDIELLAEGPISKTKRSSFLLAYRRSNVDFAYKISSQLRGYLGNAPNVQDLTFKLYWPNKNGFTSWYGIGGESELQIRENFADDDQDIYKSWSFVTGLKNNRIISSNSSLTTSIAYSGNFTGNGEINYQDSSGRSLKDTEYRYSLMSIYKLSLNKKHSLKAGIVAQHVGHLTLREFYRPDSLGEFNRIKVSRNYKQLVAFLNWKWNISRTLIVNGGINSSLLTLNTTGYLDPRVQVNWIITDQEQLTFGLGTHSQFQPAALYFTGGRNSEGDPILRNINLDPSRSNHYIISYHNNLLKNLNITNGIFFSQRVLLELTNVGFTREESYKIVQKNAMNAWKQNS
ncbi:MAG: hypothetical protein AAGA10_27015, partial [Bacteroidota bacterium]